MEHNSIDNDNEDDDMTYQYLVVDSGPIIRRTALTTLWKKARTFYTVPAVVEEIRDAKAREHLEQLPFDLKTKLPSSHALQAVVDFSRLTGDLQSLSSVDLQVLALLYDLEQEGCGGDMSHVRQTPKRTVGVGKIQLLGEEKEEEAGANGTIISSQVAIDDASSSQLVGEPCDFEGEGEDDDGEDGVQEKESEADDDDDDAADDDEQQDTKKVAVPQNKEPSKPKSWATLVNPAQASTSLPQVEQVMNPIVTTADASTGDGGQFSDAESDIDAEFDPGQKINDEECNVYIRDASELEHGGAQQAATPAAHEAEKNHRALLEADLQSDFPSLAAARLVPYEGSDDEGGQEEKETELAKDDDDDDEMDELEAKRKADEERKQRSLQPISKSGKLYNSFRNYEDLMKPKPVEKKVVTPVTETVPEDEAQPQDEEDLESNQNESRIIGGMSLAGQDGDVEDDGEGWITCTKDIRTMKSAGALDPKQDPNNLGNNTLRESFPPGPPIHQRAACATTDFAMQNVILQMNLELLSVDGMKVRKLKTWVTRCGACFKVYTSTENVGPLGSKRLFCERCGSDMMQRIAASVDGKTGRLRLHLSKKYKHNLRGTKFSLPKPGTGNRFQGDLLLREDQLMTGAWNQKVKMRSGGKARRSAESIFGADIASNVGCHKSAVGAMGGGDIRVGFGRRNPNAAKGRERRGKKKKSTDKACGLRRY